MKTTLATIALLLVGCNVDDSDRYSITTTTFDRATKTYSHAGSQDAATAAVVNAVVSSIDWTTGDTRSAVQIKRLGSDANETHLHVQHDLKAHDVRIYADWKMVDERLGRHTHPRTDAAVLTLVAAFTKGEDLTPLADWSAPGGDILERDEMAEQ